MSKTKKSDQPKIEWCVEMFASWLLLRIGLRAVDRGDDKTTQRMIRILDAGAACPSCGVNHHG